MSRKPKNQAIPTSEINTVTSLVSFLLSGSKPATSQAYGGRIFPITEGQVMKIADLTEQLGLPMPKYAEMTSAMASSFIGNLIKQIERKKETLPASERQLERLLTYIDMGLITKLPDPLSQKVASEVIGQFNNDYLELKLKCVSPLQMRTIAYLMKRMGSEMTEAQKKELSLKSKEIGQQLVDQLTKEVSETKDNPNKFSGINTEPVDTSRNLVKFAKPQAIVEIMRLSAIIGQHEDENILQSKTDEQLAVIIAELTEMVALYV